MLKITLVHRINKFYTIFAEVLGYQCTIKPKSLKDIREVMSDTDFLSQVLYDIDEVLEGYDYDQTDSMVKWLTKLHKAISNHLDRKPLLPKVFIAISTIAILWATVSTVEIAVKNTDSNPQYSSANLWMLLFNNEEEDTLNGIYLSQGTYYTNGTVVTYDGNEWGYTTDSVSDETEVRVVFDDNGTPNEKDDIILGLVENKALSKIYCTDTEVLITFEDGTERVVR